MAGAPLTEFLRHLRRASAQCKVGELTDAELLEQFVTCHEEAAFTALVQRHGPMVLSVCRQFLQDPHDVEDAFQATFLVLVRKAASIQKRAALGSWLYGVAYRTAVRARATAARRRAHEKQGSAMATAPPSHEEIDREWRSILHEEIQRLPEKYRSPLVLCYFQGKTNEEAARQLACPLGTIKGRLTRARQLLHARLTRRGLALSTGFLVTTLAQTLAPAAVPVVLREATVRAALLVAAGQAVTAGVVSAPVAALTNGVLRTMFLTKLTVACTVLLGLGIAGTSAGRFTYHLLAEPNEVQSETLPDPVAQAAEEPKKDTAKNADAADRKRIADDLEKLALALHEHHDVHGQFPPAAVIARDGRPLLSWRVLLLPYLGEEELFKEFKLDEPWDSVHNKKLLARMPKVYAPVRPQGKDPHTTVYLVLNGPGTIFEGVRACRIADITDGTSNTILIVEAAEAVPWTQPADLPYDAKKPLPKLGGTFPDGFFSVFADGAAHFLKKNPKEEVLRALISRNGEEVIPSDF